MNCDNGGVRCTKHEGAGNDFIVVVDRDDALRLSGAQIRLLCDRHRGIGADGIIGVTPGRLGADISMVLHNADGSEAEMSGNGIRCLAQAAVDAALVTEPSFCVATGGGMRQVTYSPDERPGWGRASVAMGRVTLGSQREAIEGRLVREVDVGNPHLVLLGDGVAEVDIGVRGPELQSKYPAGVNVEWIELAKDDDGPYLELRVYERGAGETLACGTGSVAAAAAARDWGVVDGSGAIRVHNPGGMLTVTLGSDPESAAVLAGPVRKVADIDIHPGMFS